ncbi:MAG: hypothetical protein E7474_05290 [Ruminococcaceae bacterium]|nr:hypothetical protein [Oscillospiraceae bacterium]
MQFICYPKCTTCQKAKKWLDANGIAYEERHIKDDTASSCPSAPGTCCSTHLTSIWRFWINYGGTPQGGQKMLLNVLSIIANAAFLLDFTGDLP